VSWALAATLSYNPGRETVYGIPSRRSSSRFQSLWANKLRTDPHAVGVVIGVASVIAVITLVNGANQFVATKISGYGSDTLTVSKLLR